MADQLAALTNLRDQAASELDRLKRERVKLDVKIKDATTKHATLSEAVAHITALGQESAPTDSTRKDRILKIIQDHDGTGMTAKDILDVLENEGVAPPGKNPSASVHVAADQLAEAGHVVSLKDPKRGKIYKPLTLESVLDPADKPPPNDSLDTF